MKNLRLNWTLKEDIKHKARFLEILFIIATLMVAIKSPLAKFTQLSLLLFAIFGLGHYALMINGVHDKENWVLSYLTSFSFSAALFRIFIRPENGAGWTLLILLYIFPFGFILGTTLLPQDDFERTIDIIRKIVLRH